MAVDWCCKARDVSHVVLALSIRAKLDTSAYATYTWSVILIVVGAVYAGDFQPL